MVAGAGGPAIVADPGAAGQNPARPRPYTARGDPPWTPDLPSLPVIEVEDADRALRRELYFYNLYRLLEAALLVLVLFGPVADMLDPPRYELLARTVALSYAFIAALVLAFGARTDLRAAALTGIAADLLFGLLAIHALPSAANGIALMLVFNVGAAALLLPPRLGVGAAVAAALGVLAEHAVTRTLDGSQTTADPLLFGLGFIATATITSILGRQMRDSHELAQARGEQTAHLVEVNELILRRLRTGVLLIDGHNRMRLANEAATLLLGEACDGGRDLELAAPALFARLEAWRHTGDSDDTPLQIAPDQPEVVPRFTRLLAGSDTTLVFLDDTSLVSRRAESLTLATLGRFSASLAHEIRNPLAAINYAVQLLQESDDIAPGDRRLLEIIRQQGTRMNGIVENVLGLARREPAKAEYVELVGFCRQFVDDYRAGHPLEQDELRSTAVRPRLAALVDPRQLHQVLTALVHNALLYGRMPGQPARVTLHVYPDAHLQPTIDIIDRGPGIPEGTARHLFRPFFTTSGHGTGLGLYVARELCRANQAALDHVALPAGGSCFRIRLAGVVGPEAAGAVR